MTSRTTCVIALAYALCVIVSSSRTFGDDKYDRPSLKGVTQLHVVVETISPDVAADGLSKHDIQTNVELLLRGIRLEVVDADATGRLLPYLYIRIDTHKVRESRSYAFAIEVALKQKVKLVRDEEIAVIATTWSTGSIGFVGERNVRTINDAVERRVKEFVNAYLSQKREK